MQKVLIKNEFNKYIKGENLIKKESYSRNGNMHCLLFFLFAFFLSFFFFLK